MPALQHHPEPALQQQDLPHDLLVQCLLQGLPLGLLQDDFYHFRLIVAVLELHIKGIIQYVLFLPDFCCLA